jgi:hypothetical protein
MFYSAAALWIAAIGLIVGAAGTSGFAQAPSQPGAPVGQDLAAAREQAQRSLSGLRSFVTPETFQRLGFESIEEVSRARIEEPIPVFIVTLDRLRAYTRGQDPANLLVPTNQVRFPLSVDGEVRSSITLRLTSGTWEVERIGRPELTKRLSEVIQASAPGAPLGARAASFFQVSILGLNLDFVGQRADTRILLTSVVDDPLYRALHSRVGAVPSKP